MHTVVKRTFRLIIAAIVVLAAGSAFAQTAETVTYGYDAQGRLSTVTYPDGTSKTYLYENPNFPNAMTGELDENGQRFSSWTYDTQGRAINTVEAGGAGNTSLVYNADGSVTVTDALGAVRTFTFGRYGDRNLTTGISGSKCPTCQEDQATTYDLYGFVSSRTDYNNNVTTYVYDDSRGLELSRTEAFGTPNARTITTQWHATYHLPLLITEPNRTTAFTYDASGNLLSRTLTDTATSTSRTWTYTYNNFGQVLTADGPRTDVNDMVTYTYYTCTTGYECGQIHTVTDALGHTTTFNTYNVDGQPLTITDANGVVTTLTYDLRQRLTSRAIGTETTVFAYYPTGLLQKVTLPDGSFLTYLYDNAHRLTEIDDANGNRMVYTLDAMGNHVAENLYDPSSTLARTHTRVFNSLNQLYQDINAANTAAVTTTFGYDNNGNQTTINAPLSRNTATSYDALNRLTQVTDPNNGITQYAYDANDQLSAVTDPRHLQTSYTYNGLGDLTQQISPDTGITHNTFDDAGNIKTSTDARGQTATYSYDASNRLTQLSYPDQTITYAYDNGANGIGHLTQVTDTSGTTTYTYTTVGRIQSKTQTTNGQSFTTNYGYNAAGQLINVVTPSGQTVSYGYTNNLVTSVTVNGTAVLTDAKYSPFGPTTGWTWGNGQATTRTYDTDGYLTANTNAGSSTYTYNPDGSIATKTDADSANLNLPTGITALNVSTSSNQLTSSTGVQARSYVYDAVGNTTSDGPRSFTYNAAGRMTTATNAGLTTTYVYNALGQRVQKTNTQTTYFTYDEAGHLLGEYDASGHLLQELVWLNDIPVASIRVNQTGNIGVFYIHTDHLNAPTKLTEPATNAIVWRWDHDPFGNGAPNEDPDNNGQTVNFNLRFPGQYYDAETSLLYNYFRYFDPQSGRYITSDPIGLAGGSLSTYAYVGGNPISLIDPTGLWSPQAHDAIIDATFPTWPASVRAAVEQGSAEVDAISNQFGSNSFMHAMREPGQSVADAKAKACAFINGKLKDYEMFRASKNPTLRRRAYVALGQALHPIMDSTSPVHAGWQVWNQWDLDQVEQHGNMPHTKEDLSALTHDLLAETMNAIHDAMNGNPCGCAK